MLLFIVLLSTFLISWFILDWKRYSKYPPGPLRLPIIGNLIQIGRISELGHIAYHEISKKYGDVVFVRIGSANTVVCHSLETIKFMKNHEFTQNRAYQMAPGTWERMFGKNLGIIWANGPEQKILRRFTIRTLRDFGFGKAASMDAAIEEEMEKFLEHLKLRISENGEKGIENANALFDLTVTNIAWRLVTGMKYELNDEKMLKLLRLSHDVFQSIQTGMSLVIAFPFLFHLFPERLGKLGIRRNMDKLAEFLNERIQYHREQGDYKSNPQSFLDVFLAKIEEEKENGEMDTSFREEQLMMTLLDLFQAASDTSSNMLSFCMLYMLKFTEVQEKVQKEMDQVLSKGETIIGYSKRHQLPYTQATMLECHRFGAVAPIPGAHVAEETFYINGHMIEKGVYLMANLQGMHYSEKVWGDPYNFRPDRFLNEEGQIDTNLASNVQPFGFGSRICLGVSLAENSLFTYFASMLRNFKLSKVCETDVLSTVPNDGITQAPKPYRIKLIPRI